MAQSSIWCKKACKAALPLLTSVLAYVCPAMQIVKVELLHRTFYRSCQDRGQKTIIAAAGQPMTAVPWPMIELAIFLTTV